VVKKIIIVACIFFVSCGDKRYESRRKINQLICSKNPCDIIEANFIIGETRDSLYVPALLKDIYDPRVCAVRLTFKGISVYSSKMGALRKLLFPRLHFNIETGDTSMVKYFQTECKERSWTRN
jgi:hypothetical protein